VLRRKLGTRQESCTHLLILDDDAVNRGTYLPFFISLIPGYRREYDTSRRSSWLENCVE
jgi:hypothetical protein